ncbi:MAG: arginine--tRNA ligase [candidate division WOR-3 bacterium]
MVKPVRTELKEVIQNFFPQEKVNIDYVPSGKKGDYATNLALQIGKHSSTPPMKIASEVIQKISSPMIDEIIIYEPGFINFLINKNYLLNKLREIDKINIAQDKNVRINVEFVSANPTGPLNIVNARAAAFGDALVKLLSYAGYQADAEFYINDSGRQIDLLGESIQQRMNELQGKECNIPDDGYHGEYIKDLAREILKENITNPEAIKRFAVEYFVTKQKNCLEEFRVYFKNWIPESSIRKQGYVEKVLSLFEKNGLTYAKDNALFLKTTQFGDTRDRVIVTSDNRYTYLLPDIAYHQNKIERGYDRLITILGPDHLGQVKSLTSALVALGYPADILKVIIVQEVKLKKDGRYIPMSKRAGAIWTLDDLLEKLSVDVIRFFLLMRSCSQHLDFDMDLALKESEENPVYYVQYAYARIKNIIKFGGEKGIEIAERPDLSLLRENEEFELIKQSLRFFEMIEDALNELDPFSITHYLISLARTFHYFYQKHRVVSDDRELTQARLFLISKVAHIFKTGLGIIGVSCPERM